MLLTLMAPSFWKGWGVGTGVGFWEPMLDVLGFLGDDVIVIATLDESQMTIAGAVQCRYPRSTTWKSTFFFT